jgi:hypothetical protein
MYYSISEASKLLKVSKVTIYKKLDKVNGLKEHIKQLKEGKCISEEGFELLKKSIQLTPFTKPLQQEFKADNENEVSERDLIVYKQLITNLESQVNDLKDDRQKLYEQLGTKDKQIDSLTRLNENSQVLLKQHQEKILFLEDSQTKEPEEKKSLWKRLANKLLPTYIQYTE